jgi:sugar phosphate permease
VLHEDPTRRSLRWAVHYVLRIPSNRTLIIASALGYFFLTGLQTFAVVFMRGRFQLGQGTASSLLVLLGCGAIVGVLITGRLADRLIRMRHIPARITVAAIAFLVSAGLFVPGLLVPSLAVAAPLFFVAAAALGGTNPPLDAARLDIVHSRLWGRAESVRSVLRSAFAAIAPLVFGYVSELFGGTAAHFGEPNSHVVSGSPGLDLTFLVMLFPLAVAGLITFRARRTYAQDVATAVASERATRESGPVYDKAS